MIYIICMIVGMLMGSLITAVFLLEAEMKEGEEVKKDYSSCIGCYANVNGNCTCNLQTRKGGK